MEVNMDYNKVFIGYNVPDAIKQRAINISKRFAIDGICDPMYISNTIAYISGSGDGKGHFTSDVVTNHKDIADMLQGAYGCNIQKSDVTELQRILETGSINKREATNGMNDFIKRLETEKKTCDEWRVGYLDREIDTLKENIAELRK